LYCQETDTDTESSEDEDETDASVRRLTALLKQCRAVSRKMTKLKKVKVRATSPSGASAASPRLSLMRS